MAAGPAAGLSRCPLTNASDNWQRSARVCPCFYFQVRMIVSVLMSILSEHRMSV